MVWKRFGALMNRRSACNIGVAGGLMFLIFALLADFDALFILPYAGGLAAYCHVSGRFPRNHLARLCRLCPLDKTQAL